jgi:protein involved in sex pheromone biosynthesis
MQEIWESQFWPKQQAKEDIYVAMWNYYLSSQSLGFIHKNIKNVKDLDHLIKTQMVAKDCI